MEDSNPSASAGQSADLDFLNRGVLLMRLGRLLAPLVLSAAALALFLRGSLSAALFVLAAAAAGSAGALPIEQLAAARTGISRRTLLALEFRVYFGSNRTNALFLSPFLRALPILLSIAAAVLFWIRHAASPLAAEGIAACLCAAVVSGVSLTAPVAAWNAAEALRRRDISVAQFLALPQLARVRLLLADQSVFYGAKSAELRGFYTDGVMHPAAELDFDEHLPLVLGFCRCDDGSLAAACGFRQRLSDVLLRAMRTTPMEHRSALAPVPTVFEPFDRETGVIASSLTMADGSVISYRAGKPESLLPQATHVLDHGLPRSIDTSDQNRVSAVIRRAYETGRQVIALVSDMASGGTALVGCLIYSTAPVEGAEAAVQSLRQLGVGVVYVSREDESCAFCRASALGITNDLGRVLTGTRIDNFRPENLARAVGRARVAAGMDGEHRLAFTAALAERGELLAAASDDAEDPLFAHADVCISPASDGCRPADIQAKQCKITDLAEIFRTVRDVCNASARAAFAMLAAPIAATLFMLLASASAALPPLTVPAAVLLSYLLPLPFAFLSARRGAPSIAPKNPLLSALEESPRLPAPRRSAGRFFHVFCLAGALFAALYAARLYGQLAPVTNAGEPAASAAAFLTLLASAVVLALIAFVWGDSLFALLDRRSRPMLWLAAAVCAAAYGLSRWQPFNSLFGFEQLSLRILPQTIVPALAAAVLYELGALAVRLLKK